MVTKKDIDAQCISFSSSTLVQVVENGTKTGITINPVAYQPFDHIEKTPCFV
jgi:activator of 2-hydroxyglutaryl-CoA dehydratase